MGDYINIEIPIPSDSEGYVLLKDGQPQINLANDLGTISVIKND